MKKNYFYEKTSFIVFAVIAIIIMAGSLILNALGYISTGMLRIIVGPLGLIFIGVFVHMVHRALKDKKLRAKEIKISKVSVESATGPFTKSGDAFINIDGFKYFIQSPFVKEGVYPKTNDTFYSYLSSSRASIKPIAKKMVRWLKKDMKLADTAVNEYQLCCHFRDLRVIDSSNPLFLFYVGNEKLNLIFAIELLERNDKTRGLEHISALINAASAHERVHYAGGGLLDAFDLFKNGEMMPKIFRADKIVGYCFLYKN